MEPWWNDTDRVKRMYSEKKTHSPATSSTRNPTQTSLAMKPGLRGARPATNLPESWQAKHSTKVDEVTLLPQ